MTSLDHPAETGKETQGDAMKLRHTKYPVEIDLNTAYPYKDFEIVTR